jgi:hypothetical protein
MKNKNNEQRVINQLRAAKEFDYFYTEQKKQRHFLQPMPNRGLGGDESPFPKKVSPPGKSGLVVVGAQG